MKKLTGNKKHIGFIPHDGNLRETIIPENTYISSNRITKIRDSVLYYLLISGTKYSIY